MADHMIKMSEVPKGQRYQQFKDYYRTPLIFCLSIAVLVISIIKTTVFSPKPDAFVVTATKYDISTEFLDAMESKFFKVGQDVNGDEKALLSVTPIKYNELILKTDPEAGVAMQTKMMGVLSTTENIIQIVDDELFDYFLSQKLIGTYNDLGDKKEAFRNMPDEIIKIPLNEIPFFNSEEFKEEKEGLYMTIRPRAGSQLRNSKKKIEKYERQIDAFINLFK